METPSPYTIHADTLGPLLSDPTVNRFEHEVNWPCLKALLPPSRGIRTILDFGCGAGNITQELSNLYPKAQVIGADASTAMMPKTSSTKRLSFTAWDGTEKGFEASPVLQKLRAHVDLLIAKLALHYLDLNNLGSFLKSANHLISTRNCVVISLPHPEGVVGIADRTRPATYTAEIGSTGFYSLMTYLPKKGYAGWLDEVDTLASVRHRSLIHEPRDRAGHKKRLNIGIYTPRTRTKILKRLGVYSVTREPSGLEVQF